MADFNISLAITLPLEGGYVNDPKDPGGETNHGITMATFRVTAHPLLGIEPTSDNLKALAPAQAGIIYRANYWNIIRGDDLSFQPLANNVFDFYVNAGTHAVTLLQNVVNTLGASPAVVITGVVGQQTLAALAELPPPDVYAGFKQGRIDYYTRLGVKYPRFLKGWLKRANIFPDLPANPGTIPAPTGINIQAAAAVGPSAAVSKKKAGGLPG